MTNFLVIGSGVAGLRAAIESANSGEVLIITKGKVRESSTWRAQGGIAVALSEGDKPELHMKDTLKAGAGLCNKDAVKVLVEEGIPRVEELISWGAKFDRENGHLSFTMEAAHKIRRIIHAMGDATGEEVHKTLMHKAREIKNIKFLEHTFLVDLIIEEKECLGALIMTKNGKLKFISAAATILASGGSGQLYKNTTNPTVATGDGLAAAYSAGCKLQDMEFIQFHPTTLYLQSAPCFLISESVRGEGGILRNSKGETFMSEYHEMGDLAPRDVVARAIYNQMWRTKTNSVFLDMKHLQNDFLKRRFPNIYLTCKEYNLDITRDLIPVRPAAHFLMGGVKTNLETETNIKRLFACGEVASTGVHGANRLASNSLLEGLVFGRRAGIFSTKYTGKAKKHHEKSITNFQLRITNELTTSSARTCSGRPARQMAGGACSTKAKQALPLQSIYEKRMSLQRLMEKKAGIIRCGKSLKEATKKLEEWDKISRTEPSSQEEFELQNMVTVARLITSSALKREESRGAHFRSDFPVTDNKKWKKHIITSLQKSADCSRARP